SISGNAIVAGGSLSVNPGPDWHVQGVGGFFGTGNSDILLRNDDGSLGIWSISGTVIVAGGAVSVDPGASWPVKGISDFGGDGRSDILLQNDDGTVALWEMSGTVVAGGGGLSVNPGPAWHALASSSAVVACFAEGTRLRTPAGDVVVEILRE